MSGAPSTDAVPTPVRPLVTPGAYFREHADALPVQPALLAAAVATLASFVAAAAAMWAILGQIPPDATFEVGGETVPARSAAEDAALRQLGIRIPGTFFAWALVVLMVHLGSLLDASRGDVTDSAAVASWGFAVLSLEGVVRGTALAVLVRTNDPASSVAELERQVTGAVTGLRGVVGPAVQVAAAAWFGYVVYQGLRHARGMRRDGAALVGGSLALVVAVLGLA